MDTPVTRPHSPSNQEGHTRALPSHPPSTHRTFSVHTTSVFSVFFRLPCLLRPFAYSGTEGSGMGWAGEQRTCAFAANSCLPCFLWCASTVTARPGRAGTYIVSPPPVPLSTYKPWFYLHTHTHTHKSPVHAMVGNQVLSVHTPTHRAIVIRQ